MMTDDGQRVITTAHPELLLRRAKNKKNSTNLSSVELAQRTGNSYTSDKESNQQIIIIFFFLFILFFFYFFFCTQTGLVGNPRITSLRLFLMQK